MASATGRKERPRPRGEGRELAVEGVRAQPGRAQLAIRFWNYALCCGAIAAAALTLLDLPQPANYATEGYRILWTLCGVAIGVLVMFLAGLLARRTAKAPPQPAAQST